MADALLPLGLCLLVFGCLYRKADVSTALLAGAGEGLRNIFRMLPSLVILLSGISMLRSSGAIEAAAGFLSPVLRFLSIPPETILLLLIRPFSGSAALAVGTELILRYGPDSRIGRTAAVMLGSTETTFYVISVYLGSCGIRSARYAPAAALIADAVGFLTAGLTVGWFFP